MRRLIFRCILLLIIASAVLTACAKKEKQFADRQGRFIVTAPPDWEIQTFNDPRGKTAFSSGDNFIVVAIEEEAGMSALNEAAKNRVRTGMPEGLKEKFGEEPAGIFEKPAVIDGAEGWIYGFSLSGQNLRVTMALFVKAGRMYSITANLTPEQEQIWLDFLKSFKVP